MVPPTGRYDVAHQLPTDLFMLHAVTVNDNLIEYAVYGDKVFSDSSTSDNWLQTTLLEQMKQLGLVTLP